MVGEPMVRKSSHGNPIRNEKTTEKQFQDKHLKNRPITPLHHLWPISFGRGTTFSCVEVMFLKKLLWFFEAKKGWCLSLFATPNPHKWISSQIPWFLASWWSNQPIWKIHSSKWESFPFCRGENKNTLKPPQFVRLRPLVFREFIPERSTIEFFSPLAASKPQRCTTSNSFTKLSWLEVFHELLQFLWKKRRSLGFAMNAGCFVKSNQPMVSWTRKS